MTLSNVIENAKLAEFVRNEKAIADRLAPERPPLSDRDKALFHLFAQWCAHHSVRSLPATPAVVAAFILEHEARGSEFVDEVLGAITRAHALWLLANPVATEIVSQALLQTELVNASRSFDKREKLMFATLPRDMQRAVARRENDRDKALRRAQNEAGDLRNEVKRLKAAVEPKSVEDLKTKEVTANV